MFPLKTLYRLKYPDHASIKKIRRCFLWNGQYFQLDMYTEDIEKYVSQPPKLNEETLLTEVFFIWRFKH